MHILRVDHRRPLHIVERVDHRRPLHIVDQANHHRNQYAHPSGRPPSTPTYRRLGRSSSKSICTSFSSTAVDPYISSIRPIIIEINMHILRVDRRRPLHIVDQADHHRNQYAHPSVRPPSPPTHRRSGRSSSKSICTSFSSTALNPYISSIRPIIIEINMHILQFDRRRPLHIVERVDHRRPLHFKSIPTNKDYSYKLIRSFYNRLNMNSPVPL